MQNRPVDPPKLVWITGFGGPTRGLLVEWRKRKRQGREEWAGVIVHVVTYTSQEGHEWSVRVDVMSPHQFESAQS